MAAIAKGLALWPSEEKQLPTFRINISAVKGVAGNAGQPAFYIKRHITGDMH
jgi:hypothetical protein